jgi:hypothetical protein
MRPEDNVIVRSENTEDAEERSVIHSINEAAFGCREEADLVDRLRTEGVVLASLVAEMLEQIVGHILFSRMSIETAGGSVWAAALAPMAVLPEHQQRGHRWTNDPSWLESVTSARGADRHRRRASRVLSTLWLFQRENTFSRKPFSSRRFHGDGTQPRRSGWRLWQGQIPGRIWDLVPSCKDRSLTVAARKALALDRVLWSGPARIWDLVPSCKDRSLTVAARKALTG